MHLKRSEMPRTWPIARKGTKYIVRPKHNLNEGIPLLVILRDMLNIINNKREAKKILNSGKIKINGKTIKEEKYPVGLFDNISLDNKNFKLVLENKKFKLIESKMDKKIIKIIGKKILRKNKIQINLSDGRNYLFEGKAKTGDSVVVDLKENKISEILPFKVDCKIMFIAGKHLGRTGKVEKIDEEKKIALVKVEDEKINSRLKDLMVVK